MSLGSGGRKVVIEFLGDSKDLVRATHSGEKALHGFGSKAVAAGRIAGKALAGGLLVAGAAGIEFTKQAAEDQEAARRLALQLKNNAKATDADVSSVERWITKQGLAKGVADDDLRPALGKLVTVTHDIGKAQKLTSLAMDISAGSGKSLESVTSALAKAQNGSLGGLARLGVATKDQAGHTLTLQQVTDSLSKAYKGQATDAANTASGQYRRLGVQMHELEEQIGYKLLPVAVKLGNWMLQDGLPAAEKLGGWLKDKLGPVVHGIADAFKGGTDKGGQLGDTMDSLSGFVDDVRRAWSALSPFLIQAAKDYLPVIVKWIQFEAKALKATADAAIWLWNNALGPVLKLELNAFAAVADQAGQMLDVLGHVPGMGWAKDLGHHLEDAADKAHDLADKIHDIPTHHDVTVAVHVIGTQAAIHHLAGADPSGLGRMGASAGADLTGGLSDGILAGREKVSQATQTLIDNLKSKLSGLRSDFSSLRDSVAGAFTGNLFEATTGSDFLTNLTSTKGTLQKLKTAFKKLEGWGLKPAFLSQLFQSGNAGLILDLANDRSTAVQAGSLFGQVGSLSAGLGASVAKDSLGPKMDTVNQHLAAIEQHTKGNGGGGRTEHHTHIHLHGVIDARAAGAEVEKVLIKHQRAVGRRLQFQTA